jgi:hypothetical protein
LKQYFSADWLSLREPPDRTARSARLRGRVADWGRAHDALRIVDLGSGTGSGLRWLAPALPVVQDWWLVDHDAELLARWPMLSTLPATVTVHTRRLDLVRDLDRVTGPEPDLVTASALLDLVSAEWLDRLARLCERAGANLYCTLNVDGTLAWNPALADDHRVNEHFNRHQRGDKGFGPALGAAAVDQLAERLRALGYRVEIAASPWRLGPEQRELQQALLDGYRRVVEELEPGAPWLADWLAQRRALIGAAGAEHRIGHRDLFAWLPAAGD